MFQWSFDATHMKHTYRCAHVCDAWCQFWRPLAPTLASYHANAGFAEDFSRERLPGKCQQKQSKFVTAVVTERNETKEKSKKQKKRECDGWQYLFPALCFLVKKTEKNVCSDLQLTSALFFFFEGAPARTANITNQRVHVVIISNFFAHSINRGTKKANSVFCWTWQTTGSENENVIFWANVSRKKQKHSLNVKAGVTSSVTEARLLLWIAWNWPFQCCYGNEMRSRDNRVVSHHTRDCANGLLLTRFSSSSSSFFFNPPVILLSLFPPQLLGDTQWRHPPCERWTLLAAPAVWVKSPLAQLRELCLLGPAALQLPHRHTWGAPQLSPLGFTVTLCRTRRTAVAAYCYCCCCVLLAQYLKGPIWNILTEATARRRNLKTLWKSCNCV